MSYVSEVTADSPALWWRLGESAGTEAADTSGNSRKGTYGAGVTLAQTSLLVSDTANTAVTLSNTSTGRITSTYNPFTGGSTRTFEGWSRRSSSGGLDTLFGGDSAFVSERPLLNAQAGAPGAVRFYPRSVNFAEWANAWPGDNQNVHWVLVYYDALKEAELFINGVSKGKKGTTDNYAGGTGNFTVGAWKDTFIDPWDGKMDEIAVYTTALSEARIKAHYEAGIAAPPVPNLGVEYGAIFTLTGPRGDVAVFNDDTSPDYVGILSPESSGLDSAEVREDANDLSEEDGGVHGNFYYGRRPVILQGTVIASSKADRAAKIAKIKRASNAMRSNSTLKWTDSGGPSVMLLLRRQQPVRFSKGYVKDFMIPMVSALPYIEGQTLKSNEVDYVEPGQIQTGTTFPSTGENKAGIGTVAWVNPGNITAGGEVFATAALAKSNTSSNYLIAKNFKFAIPNTDADGNAVIIQGIAAVVSRKQTATGATIFDNQVSLIKGGVIQSPNKAAAEQWGTVLSGPVYGSDTDLWAGSWTPADINSAEFGLALAAWNTSSTTAGEAKVDAVWMVITYRAGGVTRTQVCTNEGDAPASPVLEFKGEMPTPSGGLLEIENAGTGQKLVIDAQAAGMKLDNTKILKIDTKNRTITYNDVNIYDKLDFTKSNWFSLEPGANNIVHTPVGWAKISWRDTYL